MKKNNYIQDKSLKTFFIASVLVSIVSRINTLIDGLIVSNLLSPDAISAIGVTVPVFSLLYLFAGVIGSGAALVVVKVIGSQNYRDVKRLFTVSLITAVAVNMLLPLILLGFTDDIAELLTDEERLLPLIKDYLPATFWGTMIVVVQMLLLMFVKMTGKPGVVARAVMVEFVCNIALDFIFVKFLNLGMAGAAWATNLSCLISVLYMVPFIVSKDSMLKIVRPERIWYFPALKNIVVNGLPAAVSSISMAVLTVVLNTLILKAQGADGIFILTMSMQMMMICMLVLEGMGEAIKGIGGVMLGEKDIDSYRNLVSGILKKVVIAVAVITVILMIRPQLLARVFGCNDEMLEMVASPLRVMCLMYLPLSIVIILSCSFLLQGYKTLSSVMMVLLMLCILLPVWIASVHYPEYLWYSIPLGLWILLGVTVLCSFIISRKDRTLHWFTLVSVLPNDPNLSISVDYNREAVQKALDEVHLFLDICDLDSSVYYKIDSCIEELTYNLINMTENTGKKGSFDLRVMDDGHRIMIVVKDDGKPYNPVVKYNTDGELSAEEANLALVILNAMCPDINYKYMNGINCVYLNFEYA